MPANLDQLLKLLDLEEIEVGLFRGHQPVTKMQRAFGGQVLGQALVAGSPARRRQSEVSTPAK